MSGRWLMNAAFLLAALPAAAQSGGLRVQILDAELREPLAGATVILSNDQRLVPDTAVITGEDGIAEFPVLRVGPGYVFEVTLTGYATHRFPGIRVRSNKTERLTLMLALAVFERVSVRARVDAVDLEQTAQSSRFTDEFIQELPVPGRFYQNVLTLAPGVKDADGDGNPNVHGSRNRDFQAVVGGLSNVDPLTGKWLNFVNAESIEEIEIISAGAGVEFGRAQGGFANIVQKQGSNEFEGLFSFIYRSSRLDGTGTSNVSESRAPDFNWYQPALQLSGPIIRDRLWYRLSHEYIRRDDPINFSRGLVVEPHTQAMHADQLTWQASPRNKLAFQIQHSPIEIEHFGVSGTVPVESTRTIDAGGPTYSIALTSPYSSRLLFEGMAAYQDYEREATPTTVGRRQDCLFFARFDFGRILNPTRCLNSDTSFVSGSHPETSRDRRQRFTVRGSTTWFQPDVGGTSHRFKLGLSIENERFFRDLDRAPDIRFFTQQVLVEPCPFGGDGPCFQTLGFATVTASVPRESSTRATGNSWGVYFEDRIRILDNLTLTAGLRVDREEIQSDGVDVFDPAVEAATFRERYERDCRVPGASEGPCVRNLTTRIFTAYANIENFEEQLAEVLNTGTQWISLGSTAAQSAFWINQQGIEDLDITNTNLSPRLSLAWDPWNNGKTKFAVSAGRYHDKIFLAVPLLELEPPQTNLLFTASSLFYTNFLTFVPDQGVSPAVSVQMIDRNLTTPYQDEFSASFERTLWPETSLRVSYIRRRFRDQLQDIDINHETGDFGYCVRPDALGQATVRRSEGAGETILDVYTGQTYVDTDPRFGRRPDRRLQRRRLGHADRRVLAPADAEHSRARRQTRRLRPQSRLGRAARRRELQHRRLRGVRRRAAAPQLPELGDARLLHLVGGDGRRRGLRPAARQRTQRRRGRARPPLLRPASRRTTQRRDCHRARHPPRRQPALGVGAAVLRPAIGDDGLQRSPGVPQHR